MASEPNTDGAGDARWYVRRGSSVEGPYPGEDLRRYLLLGRIRPSDRVSADGVHWMPLEQRGDLMPAEMRDLESAAGRARFEAARRAVEERGTAGSGPARPDVARDARWRAPVTLVALAGIVGVGLVLVTVGYYRDFGTPSRIARDCGAPARGGAVWSGCVKDGLGLERGADLRGLQAVNASLRSADLAGVVLADARLDYADLHRADLAGAELAGAVLRGADLTGADLRDASLVEADLRFTDLRGADLAGADLAGARLASALWTDGTACGPESVGRCRR